MTKASFLDPLESSIFYHRAEAYLDILDFDAAISNYRQCLLLQKIQSSFMFSRRAHVIYIWGNILLDSKRFKEAVQLILGVSEFDCILKRTYALTGLKD